MGADGVPDDRPARVLVAGMPRSGTTWAANALGRCDGVTLVHEPDNDRIHVAALAAKHGLGRQPLLEPGDRADAYRRVWSAAFGVDDGATAGADLRRRWAVRLAARSGDAGADRVMGDLAPRRWPWPLAAARALRPPPEVVPAAGPRVVKTVHGSLALGWILDEVRPSATAVLVRHPANVIGSWADLGWDLQWFGWHRPLLWERFGPPERNPGVGTPPTSIEQAAWEFALLANALLAAADRHDLPVLDHEDALADPVGALSGLAGRLGLEWTDEAAEWVRASDAPGEGYELRRQAARERGRWRGRLAPDDLAVVADVLDRFPRLRGRWPLA